MKRTVLALSLMLIMLISVVAATGNVKVASAASPVWVEVARSSGGVASGETSGDYVFSVSHIDWRVRWSIVPLDSGLPIGDGSDFRFVVRPEYTIHEQVGEVSGKIFSETKTGTLVIQNSQKRTFYIEAEVCGYTSYELIIEENINSPLLDIVPPAISIFAPENKTYNLENISLTFTVDKPTSHLWYSLDHYGKIDILPNTNLSGLPEGTHNLTVYVIDEAGNKASETVYFSVEEPFTTTLIAVAAIVLALLDLGLLAYYSKKR
ncbi:hypothetical protein JXA31_00295 [Candidatus Bathyarchaeota archaeon]|nr:hypothetical protein [Candidatus Bathyarchaeota archaeon]